MVNKKPVNGHQILISTKSLNRHGLIAGATGTGKTKSLQVMVEELSLKGVPSLVMDIKGDLSGLGAPGANNKIIEERAHHIQMEWKAQGFPLEFLSISEEPGVKLRSTVSEFGPIVLSKILSLNDTQQGLLAMLFQYCDDQGLPLLDIADLKTVLRFAAAEGKAEFQKMYGLVPTNSAHAIMRKITQLEQQDGDRIFGEPSFDVADLCQNKDGLGVINVLRLTDVQSKPGLFSAFMLSLLAELFQTFPEIGDPEQPELMIFIDEAHLIFKNASKELLEQLDTIIKLIRSKGIGIVFITQTPDDIPENILSQLGFKLQHALRAFTAKDRKAIRLMAQNFPESDTYKVEDLLTELGIGEALVSFLDRKGRPQPLVHSLMRPPLSRMDVLSDEELNEIVKASKLKSKYEETLDRVSAHEELTERIEEELEAKEEMEQEKLQKTKVKATRGRPRKEKSTLEKIMASSVTRTIAREVTRGILGVFGISTTRRRSTRRRRRR